MEDAYDPTCSTEPVEAVGEEAWVLPLPIREGTFEATTTISTENVVIILQEFLTVVIGPLGPPLP